MKESVIQMRKTRNSVITIFFSILCVLALCVVPGKIYSHADSDKSVVLRCKRNTVAVEGMMWKIYKVGSKNEKGEYCLTGDYAKYPISFDDLSVDEIRGSANSLESFIVANGNKPDATGYTDKNGDVSFGELDNGLYLAVSKGIQVGTTFYTAVPLFFEIAPVTDSDYTVFPKVYASLVLSGEDNMYYVKKVWEDSDNKYSARPASITVDIYKDGELNESVVLDESNDWYYSWNCDNNITDWIVAERNFPKKYKVTIEKNNHQFLIKNVYSPTILIDGDEDTNTTAVTTTATSAVNSGASDIETVTTATKKPIMSEDSETTSPKPVTTEEIIVGAVTATDSKNVTTKKEIVNTTTVTTAAGGEKLPQTGQLWWPVIIMSLCGSSLVILGFLVKPKREDK